MTDQTEAERAGETRPRWSNALTSAGLTSALALLISTFALAVSLFEANTQRIQQRASVWPHIQLSQNYTSEGYAIRIENKGVGPALMGDLHLVYEGRRYGDLDDLIIAVVGEEDAFSYDLYRSSNVSQSVLSAGEQDTLFSVPWEPRTRTLANRFSQNGNVEACYCSIFDDCWTVTLGERGGLQQVPRCDD